MLSKKALGIVTTPINVELSKKTLTNYFPEYGWLSEETVDAMDRLSKSRIWIVDPIDGTKNLSMGLIVIVGLVEKAVLY